MTATNRYKTTGDLPAALPVLPLLGCILLPRASLPLNIFEPRYLAMISDVIAGDRMLGIIQPASADDQPEKIRASYGSNLDRLRRLKAEYDPTNVFRMNPNITAG